MLPNTRSLAGMHRHRGSCTRPLAFGGPTGMEIAHQLFHVDGQHLLTYADRDAVPATGIGVHQRSAALRELLLRALATVRESAQAAATGHTAAGDGHQ